jgi:hypothetical protein
VAPDDVSPTKSGTAAVEQAPLTTPERRPIQAKAYENRFSVAYLSLAVVVAGAIIGFAVLLKSNGASADHWSAWKPTAGGIDGTRQIADHVSRRYRGPSGAQLTTNLIAPFTIQSAAISAIAVRNDTRGSDNQFYTYNFPTNVPYTLCGLGDRCSIAGGKASLARGRLVRRQALEIALYTFKYIHGSQSVVAYLPPAAGTQLTNVVFLRKVEVEPELEGTLAATLPGKGPFSTSTKLRDDPAIDELLQEHVFRVSYTQIPDGSALAVLTPREIPS